MHRFPITQRPCYCIERPWCSQLSFNNPSNAEQAWVALEPFPAPFAPWLSHYLAPSPTVQPVHSISCTEVTGARQLLSAAAAWCGAAAADVTRSGTRRRRSAAQRRGASVAGPGPGYQPITPGGGGGTDGALRRSHGALRRGSNRRAAFTTRV